MAFLDHENNGIRIATLSALNDMIYHSEENTVFILSHDFLTKLTNLFDNERLQEVGISNLFG
jgi:hypothetical protein